MTELWKFQFEGAVGIHRFGGRCLLADEMGLGKTIQALYYCFKMPHKRPVVVVCPASVKWNWAREAKKHFGMMCDVLEGTKPKGLKRMASNHAPFIIINYDILHYWQKYFRMIDPQIVIIDECHKIKNQRSRRNAAVRELCDGVPHVIALSGTPLTNRPVELWPTLHILLPDEYPSFFDFAFKYSYPRRMPWGWTYKGAKHLKELHSKLIDQCMIRRLKKDVWKDMPSKQRVMVPVVLPHLDMYNEAQLDFLGWLRKHHPKKAHKAARALAVTRMGFLLRLAARLKVPLIYDWIDNFLEQSGGKLIVWTNNTPMIKCLQKRYGRELVHIDGSVTGRNRLAQVDHFDNDPHVRLCACNVLAAGSGVDGLQNAAETALFVDFPWTPGDLLQAEDRLHRLGQKKGVTIYYLVAVKTLEEHVLQVLLEKASILQQILDGKQEDDETELEIFNLIFDTLLKKAA